VFDSWNSWNSRLHRNSKPSEGYLKQRSIPRFAENLKGIV